MGSTPLPKWQQPLPDGGLATASMVLGIAGIFLIPLCGTGVIVAIIGIVLGTVALTRGVNRSQAITGIVTSLAALIIATTLIIIFMRTFAECADLPSQLQQICIESKLPWLSGRH